MRKFVFILNYNAIKLLLLFFNVMYLIPNNNTIFRWEKIKKILLKNLKKMKK